MATNLDKKHRAKTIKETRVETTYEYVEIFGGIISFWRKVSDKVVGEKIELQIKTPLKEYDRLFVNGEEIDIKPITK